MRCRMTKSKCFLYMHMVLLEPQSHNGVQILEIAILAFFACVHDIISCGSMTQKETGKKKLAQDLTLRTGRRGR